MLATVRLTWVHWYGGGEGAGGGRGDGGSGRGGGEGRGLGGGGRGRGGFGGLWSGQFLSNARPVKQLSSASPDVMASS